MPDVARTRAEARRIQAWKTRPAGLLEFTVVPEFQSYSQENEEKRKHGVLPMQLRWPCAQAQKHHFWIDNVGQHSSCCDTRLCFVANACTSDNICQVLNNCTLEDVDCGYFDVADGLNKFVP